MGIFGLGRVGYSTNNSLNINMEICSVQFLA